MEPNVRFWLTERQSFIQRFLRWTELLDPTYLIVSTEKIEKWRQLLLTGASRGTVDDRKIRQAWNGSLSTVHPDSSKLIPPPFRPAAFLPVMGPMLYLSLMPSKGIKSIILSQLSLYTYLTAFTIVNGNTSYHLHPKKSLLLGAGAIASSTFFGVILSLTQVKHSSDSYPVRLGVRRLLPAIFLAQLSGINVLAARGLEPAQGIKVMDKEGTVIGHSRRAGEKAVRETALSRVVLFGTSACVLEVAGHYFKRTQVFLQRPESLRIVRLSCGILVMGLMVPASFAMFPQVRQIQCSECEEEIQCSTEETELFYNRGL